MIKIYLAGAIDGIDKKTARAWRNRIKKILPKNYVCLIPKITDNLFESVNFDKFLINQADIILANIYKTPSWGTAMEIFYGHQLGKNVICFTLEDAEFHSWIKYHSTNCLDVECLEEVVDYLKHLEGFQK